METTKCGHCGHAIQRIAGLWCHAERGLGRVARHFAEPLLERLKNPTT